MNNLVKFSLLALEETSLESFYDLLIEELQDRTHADWASIFMLNKKKKLERVHTNLPQGNEVIKNKEDALYQSFNTGKILNFSKENIEFLYDHHSEEINNIAIIPLKYRKESIGVIVLSSCNNEIDTTSSKRELNVVSSIATLAIKNIQLNEDLMDALDSRELFIATAAHELRTPLAVISSYNQRIEKNIEENKPIKKSWTRSIARNSRKLEVLITDLFSVARISSGLFKYNYRQIDLVRITKRIIKDLSNLYDQTFVFDSSLESVTINGDATKMSLLITNLVNNAIKHSPKESKITAKIYIEKKQVFLAIKDQGSGISATDIERIFEKSYTGKTSSGGGLGLGLFLCKEIITNHAGDILIESKNNRGTTVTIKMPYLECT